MSKKFTSIGESVHASIPKTGQVMHQLEALGADRYTKPSEPLNYIKALIESQAADGADYIAVNLDAFGETNPQKTVEMMKEYVKLVRQWSNGVAVCIDSSNNDVLVTGLKEWYNTDKPVKQPLVNSIKDHNIDLLMPLKKKYDYAFVGLLMSEKKGTGINGIVSANDLYDIAKQIFDAAMKHGFKATEIFFDTTVFPLAIDMPMDPGVPSYTYRTFETIKKIKNDSKMAGVHFSFGVSNSSRDLPGRKVGVQRAYVHAAMKVGLDAGIVNPSHHLYEGDVDQQLIKLVETYAAMDGSPDRLTDAMMMMGDFCQSCRS